MTTFNPLVKKVLKHKQLYHILQICMLNYKDYRSMISMTQLSLTLPFSIIRALYNIGMGYLSNNDKCHCNDQHGINKS